MSQQYVIVFNNIWYFMRVRSRGKAVCLNSLTKLGDQVLCQTLKKNSGRAILWGNQSENSVSLG